MEKERKKERKKRDRDEATKRAKGRSWERVGKRNINREGCKEEQRRKNR